MNLVDLLNISIFCKIGKIDNKMMLKEINEIEKLMVRGVMHNLNAIAASSELKRLQLKF